MCKGSYSLISRLSPLACNIKGQAVVCIQGEEGLHWMLMIVARDALLGSTYQ